MSKEEIEQEAKRRYPEDISLEGSDSNRKQRKNQRIFIEGAEYCESIKKERDELLVALKYILDSNTHLELDLDSVDVAEKLIKTLTP